MTKTFIDELQETLKSKTSFANISAFIIVVGGVCYAIIAHDGEVMKSVLFLGAGYLFGSSTAQIINAKKA